MHCFGGAAPWDPSAHRCVDEDTLKRLAASPLRTFGVEVHAEIFPSLASALLKLKLQERLFIVHDLVYGWPSLDFVQRMAFKGMMGTDHPQSGGTLTAKLMEASWRNMDFRELPLLGVPDSLARSMKAELPMLFGSSPFAENGAYALDAILAVLLAAKRCLGPDGACKKRIRGGPLRDALVNAAFEGASGPVAFTPLADGNGGDRAETLHFLRQVQATELMEIGEVGGGRSMRMLKRVVFPDGGSDPRSYDMRQHEAVSQPPSHAEAAHEVPAEVLAAVAMAAVLLLFLARPSCRSPWPVVRELWANFEAGPGEARNRRLVIDQPCTDAPASTGAEQEELLEPGDFPRPL